MLSLNGNTLAVVDVETTGEEPGFHEIIQVAIVPLDQELEPKYRPFYTMIRPEFLDRAQPEAMRAHGISEEDLVKAPSKETVMEALEEWYEGLEIPMNRRLMPLCQNASFDVPFMKAFLGPRHYETFFGHQVRDTMPFALGLNDSAAFAAESLPFGWVGLKPLCQHFGIDISQYHDSLADCLATAKVYRELLRMIP